MSQLSFASEGGFSDIISDVDNFIEENGITEDVGHLLRENEFKTDKEDEDIKVAPEEFRGTANYPTPCDVPEMTYPPDQPTDLCNDEYAGPLNFDVYIVPNEQKTPWEYSPKLNKIFILTNLRFPVAFSVKTRPINLNLFIRATPVFTQAQYFQEVVQRCIAHQHPQDPSNKGLPPHIFRHIMRCSNDATRYFGDEEQRSRFNIVLPLSTPQTGSDVVKEFFYFVCQNSCPSGMNRRPIEVIFTLEDENGKVLGRRILSVRVCKCPKRDREKEENSKEKEENPPGKKRRIEKRVTPSTETVDTRLFSCNINIVGEENYKRLLQYSYSLMASEVVKMEGKSGADAPFRKCMNEVNNLMNKFSK